MGLELLTQQHFFAKEVQVNDNLLIKGNTSIIGAVSANNFRQIGNGNTGVGANALGSNNTGILNTALGASALLNNTGGSQNTAIGTSSLRFNIIGGQNTAIGATALQYNTASYNTAIGWESLGTLTVTGDFNTGCGIQACKTNTSGTQNTAIGAGSLRDNTIGSNNTCAGFTSLISCSGNRNTAIGATAGDSITTGSDNTIIGNGADVDTGARLRCLVLGAGATSPALDGSLSIGGTGGSAMDNLITASAPAGATGNYLRIWLNGVEYRIPIQAAV
jgi:hypothetical protein